MDNMILGRYIPGNSIVHRLDPRSKLVAMILLIMIVFWANNPITNVILFVVTGIFVALSEVPLSFFIKGLRSMFFLIAFTTLFQLFFISGGQVLFEMGFIKITSHGIEQWMIFLSLCVDYLFLNLANLDDYVH